MMRPALKLVPTADTPVDTVALSQIAAGQVGAMGGLYDRHSPSLLRFLARSVGPAEAEDLVQNTFVRAAKLAGSYDGRGASARSWLFGIAARIAQERRRSVFRFARALSRFGTSTATTTISELRPDLEKGLADLSEPKRMVLWLAEVEGFSCEEIATMLHVPIGTVWTRLHHARKDLRAFMERGQP